jgi:hypothetical protein
MRPAPAFAESEGASGGGIFETEKLKARFMHLCFSNTSGESLQATGAEPPTTITKGIS